MHIIAGVLLRPSPPLDGQVHSLRLIRPEGRETHILDGWEGEVLKDRKLNGLHGGVLYKRRLPIIDLKN